MEDPALKNCDITFVTIHQPPISAGFNVRITGHHLWSVGLFNCGLHFVKRSEDLERIIMLLLSVVYNMVFPS